ncbi:MAG: hypothetical protein K2J78_11630 [Muribaculaceae bacterium]|nr:hypothetical protein [Muribaculaceae bacterium]
MDKKSYGPGDIESLLSPKCDFHVSAGFKDRVIKEAQAVPKRRRWLLPWVASVGIAAAIVGVVCLLLPWRDNNMITPVGALASSGITSYPDSINGSGTVEVKTESEELFIAKVPDDGVERKSKTTKDATVKRPAAKKKNVVAAPLLLASVDTAPSLLAKSDNPTATSTPLKYGEMPLPMEMAYGNSSELVMAGIDNSNEMMTAYKSQIYANVEEISLSHENMQLTEEEKLQVRRLEQRSYASKMRLEVEMAESLIQEVYKSIKM